MEYARAGVGKTPRLRVLIVSSEWPSKEDEVAGIHVFNQVEHLREEGIQADVFHFRGHKNPVNYLKAILQFRKNNLRQFDIIHAHHGQSGIVALAQRSCPVVVTFHGSDLQGIRDKNGNYSLLGYVLRLTGKLVATFADEVIIVSEHLSAYLPCRAYTVIPIGTDTERFKPIPKEQARRALGFEQNKKYILFVGDPNRPEKRFSLASAAVEYLKQFNSVELIVASGVPPATMPLYMNACDVLLVTSANEGSPSAVKEALACNLPIVSLDVGDIRKRIEPVQGCVLCEDDRAETISKGLEWVLSRNQEINGRESIQELDERILIQRVIEIYQRALVERRPLQKQEEL